jgi:hypothetical protein
MLAGSGPGRVRSVAHSYPPLNLQVGTPRLVLAGAADDLLERLIPVVRAGVAGSGPLPFDDPMSLYEDSPEREWRWLRGIWAGRAHIDRSRWRLYFVVMVDGEPAGMQDLLGVQFAALGAIWHVLLARAGVSRARHRHRHARGRAAPGVRRAGCTRGDQRGVHRQPRIQPRIPGSGLRAERHQLGYPPRRTALITRWKLTRDRWETTRRDDTEITGVQDCLPVLGL